MSLDPQLQLIAEHVGEVATRLQTLESEAAAAKAPVDAATAAIREASAVLEKAHEAVALLKHHVLDSDLGRISVSLENLQKRLQNFEETTTQRALRDQSERRTLSRSQSTQLAQLRDQFSELKKSFATLPIWEPTGRYEKGRTYKRLQVVTELGSAYISLVDNNAERPTKSSKKWKILVERPNIVGGGDNTQRVEDISARVDLVESVQALEYSAPSADFTTGVDQYVDGQYYAHDSAIIEHEGTWILGWNGNETVDAPEDSTGQKNYFKRGARYNDLLRKTPVAEFQDATWSTNPVITTAKEWHPTLMKFGDRLECWWFSTYDNDAGDGRTLGYRSVWDESGSGKWTNYKIQLAAANVVNFSSDVTTVEAADRYDNGTRTLVAMPVAPYVAGKNGRLWMPMIISNHDSGISGLGAYMEVVIFSSGDNGSTWSWSVQPIAKASGNYRQLLWEPWLTYDATSDKLRLQVRNFSTGNVGPGQGYSWAECDEDDALTASNWTTLEDSALDVMPMRGTAVTDGEAWYVGLVQRPQVGTGFNDGQRKGMALWRSLNGRDWQPIADLLPPHMKANYCWLYARGDGYLYYSVSLFGAAIGIGRWAIPASSVRHVFPAKTFALCASKTPYCDGEKLYLEGIDYLEVPFVATHGNGWSMAALVRQSTAADAGLILDAVRDATETPTWGNGHLPEVGGDWHPKFGANLPDLWRDEWTESRPGEPLFVAWSWDETDKVMRVMRAYPARAPEVKEYAVQVVRLQATPSEGDVVQINGVSYTFRGTPSLDTDVQLDGSGTVCLDNLRAKVVSYDTDVRCPSRVTSYSTAASALKSHLWFYVNEATPGATSVDGTRLKNDGNTFDVPKDDIWLNADSGGSPLSNVNQAGNEIRRFGLWNSRLTADDMRSLLNAVAHLDGHLFTATDSTKAWSSADVLLDPKEIDSSIVTLDYFGHRGKAMPDQAVLPGDASMVIEVPGSGAWRITGDFRFSPIADGSSFELITIGEKFSPSTLTIARGGSTYSLKFGDSTVATVQADTWTSLQIDFATDGAVTMSAPGVQSLGTSKRPLCTLGRFLYEVAAAPTVNRASYLSTHWRALRVLS